MLSYRHAFHAGSPADVLKHATFAFCLEAATRNPTPLLVIDSHAGAGTYDLEDPMAEKLGEWRRGILAALRAPGPPPELLRAYLERVRAANPDGRLRLYPGSARLAADLLRPGLDRLELVELHGTDHAALEREFAGWPGVRVSKADGLGALPARLPPPERRALALIDPSYEVKADYADVPEALRQAHRRFPRGTYLLWYPVIDRAWAESISDAVEAAGIPEVYRLEFKAAPDGARRGMTASGLLVVNPPVGLPSAAAEALPWLEAALAAEAPGAAGWLVPG